jgi:hypothetical protein
MLGGIWSISAMVAAAFFGNIRRAVADLPIPSQMDNSLYGINAFNLSNNHLFSVSRFSPYSGLP